MMSLNNPSIVASNLYKKISLNTKHAFGSGFLLCLITHFFMYNNIALIHDAVEVYNTSSSAFEGGRWAVPFFFKMHDSLQMPWAIGLITCILFGFLSIVIKDIFSLKSPLLIWIISGIIVTLPSTTGFHTFFSSAGVYAVAALFAALSVLCVQRIKNKWLSALFAAVFLILSLGCYQAFLGFTAGLMLAVLIIDCLDNSKDFKFIFFKALHCLAIIIIGTLLYYAISLGFLAAHGQQWQDYNNVGANPIDSIASLFVWLKDAWLFSIKTSFIGNGDAFIPRTVLWSNRIVIVIGFFITGLAIYINKIYKKPLKLISLAVFAFLMPLAVDVIYLLNRGYVPHLLMIFAFIVPILLCVILQDFTLELSRQKILASVLNVSRWIGVFCTFIMIYNGWIIANTAYLNMKLTYDYSLNVASQVVRDVEEIPEFYNERKICVIGNFGKDIFRVQRDGFEILPGLLGGAHTTAFTYEGVFSRFLRSAVNLDFEEVSETEKADGAKQIIKDLPEVAQMPKYPFDGYVKLIDNVIVIKLS